jgi:hypothetical protein
MGDIERDMAMFDAVIEFAANGGPPREIDRLSAMGFADSGPFYRVGYRMAQRIDERAGRRPFLAAISGGPLEFLETYFETRPDGPDQVDAATTRTLKELIEEIRTVGRLDPEA